jgi:hypothetical protein
VENTSENSRSDKQSGGLPRFTNASLATARVKPSLPPAQIPARSHSDAEELASKNSGFSSYGANYSGVPTPVSPCAMCSRPSNSFSNSPKPSSVEIGVSKEVVLTRDNDRGNVIELSRLRGDAGAIVPVTMLSF